MRSAKAYWFYLLLPLLVVAAYAVGRSADALANPLLAERILLIDALVSLPLLYWLYLRSRVTPRAALFRCCALALSGLWFAGWVLQGEGQILPWLSWLRAIGLPLVFIIELTALVAAVRYTFSADPKEDQLIARGVPPLAARMMLAEARFWKKIGRYLTGR